SRAYAVSADGSVVAGFSDSPDGEQAFRWTSGGGMASLGTLPGGLTSHAYGVSADGSVVVGDGGGGAAFRWTSAGGMINLGVLVDQTNALAAGVSADGTVVVGGSGHWDTDLLRSVFRPFRWTPLGMQDLGTLPGGQFPSAEA